MSNRKPQRPHGLPLLVASKDGQWLVLIGTNSGFIRRPLDLEDDGGNIGEAMELAKYLYPSHNVGRG